MLRILLISFVSLLFSTAAFAQLKWNTTSTCDSNQEMTTCIHILESLSFTDVDDSGTSWTVPLPQRMQTYIAERGEKSLNINELHRPSFLLGGVRYSDTYIAISDKSGFLMLDRKTGQTLLDIEYEAPSQMLFFDHGSYRVTSSEPNTNAAKGRTAYGSTFITEMNGKIVHFNGAKLFVIDGENFDIQETVKYDYEEHVAKGSKAAFPAVNLSTLDFNIELKGRVYLF